MAAAALAMPSADPVQATQQAAGAGAPRAAKLAPRSRPTRPQINELEAILGQFDGRNDLLHAKL